MSKAVFVVYSRPAAPELEEEYNTWYDKTHLSQVQDVPGVTGARRFRLEGDPPAIPGGSGLPSYLALYEIDADDPAECIGEIMRRSQSGVIEMSSAIQVDPPPVVALYAER
jgi:hypothetical protein